MPAEYFKALILLCLILGSNPSEAVDLLGIRGFYPEKVCERLLMNGPGEPIDLVRNRNGVKDQISSSYAVLRRKLSLRRIDLIHQLGLPENERRDKDPRILANLRPIEGNPVTRKLKKEAQLIEYKLAYIQRVLGLIHKISEMQQRMHNHEETSYYNSLINWLVAQIEESHLSPEKLEGLEKWSDRVEVDLGKVQERLEWVEQFMGQEENTSTEQLHRQFLGSALEFRAHQMQRQVYEARNHPLKFRFGLGLINVAVKLHQKDEVVAERFIRLHQASTQMKERGDIPDAFLVGLTEMSFESASLNQQKPEQVIERFAEIWWKTNRERRRFSLSDEFVASLTASSFRHNADTETLAKVLFEIVDLGSKKFREVYDRVNGLISHPNINNPSLVVLTELALKSKWPAEELVDRFAQVYEQGASHKGLFYINDFGAAILTDTAYTYGVSDELVVNRFFDVYDELRKLEFRHLLDEEVARIARVAIHYRLSGQQAVELLKVIRTQADQELSVPRYLTVMAMALEHDDVNQLLINPELLNEELRMTGFVSGPLNLHFIDAGSTRNQDYEAHDPTASMNAELNSSWNPYNPVDQPMQYHNLMDPGGIDHSLTTPY